MLLQQLYEVEAGQWLKIHFPDESTEAHTDFLKPLFIQTHLQLFRAQIVISCSANTGGCQVREDCKRETAGEGGTQVVSALPIGSLASLPLSLLALWKRRL